MAFQTYSRRMRPATSDPVMAIQSRGTISMNSAAYRLIRDHLGGSEEDRLHLQLLFDPDTKAVGFRGVPPKTKDSYPVRKAPRAETYLVTARGFLKFYDIPMGTLRHYLVRDMGDGIIGFSLTEDERAAPVDDPIDLDALEEATEE